MSKLKYQLHKFFTEEELIGMLLMKRNKRKESLDTKCSSECNVDIVKDKVDIDYIIEELFRDCFDETLYKVRSEVLRVKPEERLELLKSFRKIVSLDLSYSKISKYVYKKK